MNKSQKDLLDKVSAADDLIRQFGAGPETCKTIMAKYGCSKSTAWRWIGWAQEAFGSTQRVKKEYWRQVAAGQISQIALKHSAKLNEKLDDPEKYGAPTKDDYDAFHKLYAELRKTIGYDKEDMMYPEASDIGSSFIITTNPESVGARRMERTELDQMLSRFTKAAREQSIDIDFEEVPDDE